MILNSYVEVALWAFESCTTWHAARLNEPDEWLEIQRHTILALVSSDRLTGFQLLFDLQNSITVYNEWDINI